MFKVFGGVAFAPGFEDMEAGLVKAVNHFAGFFTGYGMIFEHRFNNGHQLRQMSYGFANLINSANRPIRA